MPKFQLLSAHINLAGDRGNTVVKGSSNPITLPELFVLRTLHGGNENVHTLVEVGEVERSAAEEYERLEHLYGAPVVNAIFPGAVGRNRLPERDDNIPTREDVAAAKAAAEEVMSRRKSSKRKPAKKDGDKAEEPTPAVPDVAELDS